MLQLDSPKSRTESAMTHSAAGVLSTVIALAASDEPKNHAFQLSAAGLRGRRVEGVGPAGAPQAPEVEHAGAGEQRAERAVPEPRAGPGARSRGGVAAGADWDGAARNVRVTCDRS